MRTFLTGATGYIGAHVLSNLLCDHDAAVNVLVRAASQREAEMRLWRSLQLHLSFDRFHSLLQGRVNIFLGDLTSPKFGLSDIDYGQLVESTSSIIHCAASLNRKSEKVCLNVNLRGTLEMIQLARRVQNGTGLRRYSHVSTVAVAGHRQDEVVTEDTSVDWARSDYDPYARTKKFCEHMVHTLLPDVQYVIFRPSIVLGDSRRAETTQFDMVRSFVLLANLPFLPFRPQDRLDIVPVEFVADAISTIHQKDKPNHNIYHLSSGIRSQTFRELTDTLCQNRRRMRPIFVPRLEHACGRVVDALSSLRGTRIGSAAVLLKVFRAYLSWNTVFDNTRITTELNRVPKRFSEYSFPLLKFSTENHFRFNYQAWPQAGGSAA
jgi:thioester reductase-like protein